MGHTSTSYLSPPIVELAKCPDGGKATLHLADDFLAHPASPDETDGQVAKRIAAQHILSWSEPQSVVG